MNKNYFQLFLISFMFFSRQTIRNTFHVKLKQFYEKSNKINTIFYTIGAVVLTFYLLMRAI